MCPVAGEAGAAGGAAERVPTRPRAHRLGTADVDPLGGVAPLGGRVALVTGASRRIGIGAAIARRLVSDGAAVMLHSWSPHDQAQPWGADLTGADDLVAELQAGGGRAEHVASDLSDPTARAALVDAAVATLGSLDIVVANHARSSSQALEALTAPELDLTFAANVRATLLLVQRFVGHRGTGNGGRVVLFASGQYHGAMPGELPYVATKAALRELTPSLAAYLMGRGITVNCVDPGPCDTGYANAEAMAEIADRNPGRRWGLPADTARLVAWLVSDEAS